MFSLCIATMDRYDEFLSKYLPKYLDNDLIDEIILQDENGHDVEKIKQHLNQHAHYDKLCLNVNEQRLGPFLNKYKACQYAKCEWIILMDSDNFAHKDYFENAKDYIHKYPDIAHNTILAPSKAKPIFDFTNMNGLIYKKGNFKHNKHIETQRKTKAHSINHILMNTGNYVIHKYLIDHLDLSKELDKIPHSSSCDVIYFNTLLFEQLDLNLHVVPNMEYIHVVHKNSTYMLTCHQHAQFNRTIHQRYDSLE
jgi:hypothetical protein